MRVLFEFKLESFVKCIEEEEEEGGLDDEEEKERELIF
jgi:hypothetical protein